MNILDDFPAEIWFKILAFTSITEHRTAMSSVSKRVLQYIDAYEDSDKVTPQRAYTWDDNAITTIAEFNEFIKKAPGLELKYIGVGQGQRVNALQPVDNLIRFLQDPSANEWRLRLLVIRMVPNSSSSESTNSSNMATVMNLLSMLPIERLVIYVDGDTEFEVVGNWYMNVMHFFNESFRRTAFPHLKTLDFRRSDASIVNLPIFRIYALFPLFGSPMEYDKDIPQVETKLPQLCINFMSFRGSMTTKVAEEFLRTAPPNTIIRLWQLHINADMDDLTPKDGRRIDKVHEILYHATSGVDNMTIFNAGLTAVRDNVGKPDTINVQVPYNERRSEYMYRAATRIVFGNQDLLKITVMLY